MPALSEVPPAATPPWLRGVALALSCVLCVGNYTAFDVPGAIGTGPGATLESWFAAHGQRYTHVRNQSLYSVYAWPNIVLAFVGGTLAKNVFGLRRALVIFATTVCVGTWLVALGVRFTSYPLLLVGRAVFGAGAESLLVTRAANIPRWFPKPTAVAAPPATPPGTNESDNTPARRCCDGDGGTAIAYALLGLASHLIMGGAFAALPVAAERFGVVWAVDATAVAATCGVAFAVLLSAIHDRAPVAAIEAKEGAAPAGPSSRDGDEADVAGADADANAAAPATDADAGSGGGFGGCIGRTWRDVRSLPRPLVLGVIVAGLGLYAAFYPALGILRPCFERLHHWSGPRAAAAVGLIHVVGAVANPIEGLAVERWGRHVGWLVFAGLGFVAVHASIAGTAASPGHTAAFPPAAVTALIGVVYGAFSSGLFPSFPLLLSAHQLTDPALGGVAFGLLFSARNVGLAVVPLCTGALLDAWPGEPVSDDEPLLPNATATAAASSRIANTTGTETAAPSLPPARAFAAAFALLAGMAAWSCAVSLALWWQQRRSPRGVLHLSPSARRDAEAQRLLPLQGEGEAASL